MLNPDGSVGALTLVMPAGRLVAGATLVIGADEIAGVVATFPPGSAEVDSYSLITGGTLELGDAGTGGGDAITASFRGAFGGAEHAPADRDPADGGAAHRLSPGTGTVEVGLETTWGSNAAANPLAEGEIVYLEVGGADQPLGDIGATAGPATALEAGLLPGAGDLASISVIALNPDGSVGALTVVVPLGRLVAGTTLHIGRGEIAGVVVSVPAGSIEPDGVSFLTEGVLEISAAGTGPGDAVSVTFGGSFGDLPSPPSVGDIGDRVGDGPSHRLAGGPGGTLGSAAVEVEFETTWGSSQGANPLAEGQVIYLLVDNVEQPLGDIGVTAGPATPDEAGLLPGAGEPASLSLIALNEDGSVTVLALVLPAGSLTAGTTLVVGQDQIAGVVVSIPPGSAQYDDLALVTGGTLEIWEAGTGSGEVISAAFFGAFGEPGAPGDGDRGVGGTGPLDIGLVINEVAAKGDPLDWFELHNASPDPIALFGLVVADDLADAGKRVAFPDGLVIEAGEYLQLEVDKEGWPGFGLGGDEELGVWTADGILVASVDWEEGQSGEGQSYARVPDSVGEFQTVDSPTPGAANLP